MPDAAPNAFTPHRNAGTAAKQMDAAVRRIGQILLDNDTMQTLLAASMAIPALIVDATSDDTAADALMEFYIFAVREHVELQKHQRRVALTMAPKGKPT
jgi:hypothetical protein